MTAPFLKNVRYMAAWSSEIGEALFRRRIAGAPILLFRRADGDVAALTDRCSHRFAPLSMGARQGDTVRCPYHGLIFAADGACVANPFSDTIPKGATIRSWRWQSVTARCGYGPARPTKRIPQPSRTSPR